MSDFICYKDYMPVNLDLVRYIDTDNYTIYFYFGNKSEYISWALPNKNESIEVLKRIQKYLIT